MRTICLIILLAIPALTYSQLDSSVKYQTPDIKLRYYSPAVNDTLEISNVNTIVLKGDEVLTQSGSFNIAQLNRVTVNTGKGKYTDGLLPGAMGGLAIGLILGSILDNADTKDHGGGHPLVSIKNALITIPVGTILGALIGGVIFTQLDTKTNYDFPGSNADFKRIELKSLMEKYGRKK